MRTFFASLISVAASLLPFHSGASTFGAASTYSNIAWTMSTNVPGLTTCTSMRLDGTGDMANANSFVMSGALTCPAIGGGYGVVGSLYLDTNRQFNLNVLIGAGTALQCVRMNGLSGLCVFTNSAGTQLGTGSITFLP